MRLLMGLAACAALGLAGCSAPVSADATAFVAGVSAFQKGDWATLDGAVKSLKVETADVAPCSAEAFAAARREVMLEVLEPMNSGAIQSMSEEARFVFLAGTIGRGVESGQSPERECRGKEGVGLLVAQDQVERGVVIQTVIGQSKAWREALIGKYGEELNGRLKAAVRTLEANRYDAATHMSFAGIVE